jgi:hypothetical protein
MRAVTIGLLSLALGAAALIPGSTPGSTAHGGKPPPHAAPAR